MKKILAICAAVLMLGFFTTSCSKNCQCKTYVNGVLENTGDPFTVETGKKCKDYNSEITLLGITTKVKCNPTF